MTIRVGLWIDHKKAVVVSLTDKGESIRKIESGAKRVVYRGARRIGASHGAQYSQGENQLDNRFMEQLNKYYEEVAGLLRGATHILILGPGEAKTELGARLEREKGPAREIRTEPADKLTDRQIAARVREFFAAASTGS
jgi:hypothetical protein